MAEINTNNTHLVAFIDILGFKEMVNDYFSGKNKQPFINLEYALKASEEFAINFSKFFLKEYKIDFLFKQFSDCLSISMPINGKSGVEFLGLVECIINIVKVYQYILLDNNILVRGGISIGRHIENNNMIFSEALIKSYKLETEKAIYPRVLVDKQIMFILQVILNETPEIYNEFYYLYGNNVIKDWDDEIFVSPFGIARESKLYSENFGVEQLKLFINNSSLPDKALVDMSKYTDFISTLNDNDILMRFLEKINKYVRENENIKHEIIIKYKWLQQFIRWSINNADSEIKFRQYFKKP